MAGEESKETKAAGCCDTKVVWKKIYRAVTSSLGLVLLLIVYSFIGAAFMYLLEGGGSSEDDSQDINITTLRDDMIAELWNKSRLAGANEQKWTAIIRKGLQDYEMELSKAFPDGLDAADEDDTPDPWDFWGSMFYCATVYTTIGYGHIAPVTTGGQIFTMLYACLGIPFCLIVLTDLGKVFTRGIKFVWSFIRRFYHTGKCLKEGGGDQAPVEESKDETDVYVIDDEFNLPIPVAVGIAFAYIIFGMFMYPLWEDNWSYGEAFYFIFISVSTIGFGDVLPDHPRYFLLSSLYVLVGLALISMVINVIMESLEKKTTEIIEEIAVKAVESVGLNLSDAEEEAKKPAISPEDKKK